MTIENKDKPAKAAAGSDDDIVMTQTELKKMISDQSAKAVADALAADKKANESKEDKTFDTFAHHIKEVNQDQAKRFIGNPEKDNLALGKLMAFAGLLKGSERKAMELAEKVYKDLPYFEKALNTTDLVSGGVLIAEEVASDVIELLRPLTVVRNLARSRQIPTGAFRQARVTAGAISRYKGEGTTTNASQLTNDQIIPTPHILESLTAISDLLNDFTNQQSQRIAQQDLLESMAEREDLAFLRGPGTEFEPKGLLNFAANTKAQTSTAVADVRTDIRALIDFLGNANIKMTAPRFLMTTQSAGFLEDLKTAGGETNEFTLALNGNIRGKPVSETNNIPGNLGGGGDESEIYFVDMKEIVIFDAIDSFRLRVSTEATYKDSGGNDRSAFANDETVIKMMSAHDMIPRHNEAIATLTAVTYGN